MPTSSEAFALACGHLQGGDLKLAEQLLRQALQGDRQHADAWHLLGVVCSQQGRWAEAVTCYGNALESQPCFGEAHYHLGNALLALNRWTEAADSYRQAVRWQPDLAEAHSNLGAVLQKQGMLDEAAASYQQAVRYQPDLPQAHRNLGVILLQQGRLAEAAASYRHVLRLQPGDAVAHNNLGNALLEQGRLNEARVCYEQALRLLPDYALAHFNLGNLLLKQGKMDESAASYEQALRLKPDMVEAQFNLGDIMLDKGFLEEATVHYHEALRIRPQNRTRLRLATMLPPIYRSLSDLRERRQGFVDNIRRLRGEGFTLDPGEELPPSVFYLAYQGLDDRDLLRQLNRLFTPDALGPPCPGTATKIKLGIVSSLLFDHAVGRVIQGLVEHVARTDFSVYLLSVGSHDDDRARLMRQHADHFLALPANVPAARRMIRQLGLDILYYADIGMEPITYALALSRLAAVQCVLGGHPETTGIETIDYFVSSELMEVPHAQEHYTESLVRLKTLPVYYHRPPVPDRLQQREYFGLPRTGHLYGCLQTLFKLHPEFDALLGDILRRDPLGHLILIHGRYPSWDRLLLDRFRETIPDVLERIRFIPRQNRVDFLNLVAVCDVLLDPIHFGGGTTSYECFAVGTPIVTLPAEYLRGRVTLAMYKKMGILDAVADDARHYVELAVRLGTEPDFRARLRSRILAACGVLYEDIEAVREIEAFFKTCVARVRSDQARPF